MTSMLTKRLQHASRHPVESVTFDLPAALEDVLAGVGLATGDTGGRISHVGADPVFASPLRIGAGASIALLAKSAAAAAFHRQRGGPGQDIHIDLRRAARRLSPFFDGRFEQLGGYAVRSSLEVGNAMSAFFFRTRDGRSMLPQAMYAGLRQRAQELLGIPLDYVSVARAIGQRDAAELEAAGAAAGIVLPMVRTLSELLIEPHYVDALANAPLIDVIQIAGSPREPLRAPADQPFTGYRALGMGHVIAGAGLGRSLALHGADVLNLWRPGEGEHETIYASANVGLRSAWLDPRLHRSRLDELLTGADIFFHNRRPALLREIRLSASDAAKVRPGIVYVSISLHGLQGPWSERPGFDQTAGAVTGIMALEGSIEEPRLPPIVVVNDYLAAWLAQVGVVAALQRRAAEGGSYHVHVSLTRVALWLLSLGVFDKNFAERFAGSTAEHLDLEPETFENATPMGRYRGVTDQVVMSSTPGRYRTILVPRGSSACEWLARP